MRYIIFLCLITICSAVHAQTPKVISPSTTIEAFSALTPGQYRFIGTTGNKDTTDVGLDKSLVCAVCPAPIVCPICPPAKKERAWIGMSINTKTGVVIVTYSDSSTSTHSLTNTIFIQ